MRRKPEPDPFQLHMRGWVERSAATFKKDIALLLGHARRRRHYKSGSQCSGFSADG